MDMRSFLASVMDLDRYVEIAKSFHDGTGQADSKFSYLSIVIRNVLSTGFSSSSKDNTQEHAELQEQ